MSDISVIIPAYNNLELCKCAVASVLKQKDCRWELIIVDDTPTDLISKWISTLKDSRIRYYHNMPSKGAIANWNFGLSLVNSDSIVLLHHDEEFANVNLLSDIVDLLKTYDVVIHNKAVYFGSQLKQERVPLWAKKFVLSNCKLLFACNVIGPCACVAFNKTLYADFDERLHWKVDTDWYYRILSRAKSFKYINQVGILSHPGHEGQITNNINVPEVSKKDVKIINQKYSDTWIKLSNLLGDILVFLKSFFL